MVIDYFSAILIVLAFVYILLAKSKDKNGTIRRNSGKLVIVGVLVVIIFIGRLFSDVSLLLGVVSLVFYSYSYDILKKVSFNRNLRKIQNSLEHKIVRPKLDRIKEAHGELEKTKLSLDKEKEKLQGRYVDLDNKENDFKKLDEQFEKRDEKIREVEKELQKSKDGLQFEVEKLSRERATVQAKDEKLADDIKTIDFRKNENIKLKEEAKKEQDKVKEELEKNNQEVGKLKKERDELRKIQVDVKKEKVKLDKDKKKLEKDFERLKKLQAKKKVVKKKAAKKKSRR